MSAPEIPYPVAEQAPERVKSRTSTPLADITLDAVATGRLGIDDLGIAPDGLRLQAQVAEGAGRPTLAANLNRAAELVAVPEAVLMQVYELLRPGRAATKSVLLDAAARLRAEYGAHACADLVEEAAAMYERRGLFRRRY
ncbi:MAG: diol dehydratase small subunit [Geminicoccaceae bacterium]